MTSRTCLHFHHCVEHSSLPNTPRKADPFGKFPLPVPGPCMRPEKIGASGQLSTYPLPHPLVHSSLQNRSESSTEPLWAGAGDYLSKDAALKLRPEWRDRVSRRREERRPGSGTSKNHPPRAVSAQHVRGWQGQWQWELGPTRASFTGLAGELSRAGGGETGQRPGGL